MRGHTRRTLLKGFGSALGIGTLAGCTGAAKEPDAIQYVVAFHWGFRLVAPDGTVTDQLELAPDTDLRVHAVNLEPIADGKALSVPDPVSRTVSEQYSAWEDASLDRIEAKVGLGRDELEKKLDAAESAQQQHVVTLIGPKGGVLFNDPLGVHDTHPVTERVLLREPGAYDLECRGYCGFGHAQMELPKAIVVG
ncbi:MAG: hypothetical protein ABEI77_00110 [Halorientalis sp.]